MKIPDKVFKTLNHSYKGFVTLYTGQEIEPGYKPDLVLRKANQYIILESETATSRKTYVGGMMKAAHFLQNKKKGKLIFVVYPKKNTKAVSIAMHLRPYLDWIKNVTNLKDVYVIEAGKYYSGGNVLSLDCKDFLSCAFKV